MFAHRISPDSAESGHPAAHSAAHSAGHLAGRPLPRRQLPLHPLRIDCDHCVARGPACQDCMVTVLLGPPPELGFDDEEAAALTALAEGGLIPPLRMVHPVSGPEIESA
ncbi:MAG: hypothetical protein WAW88_14560 [Nocardioides sp.]